MKIFVLMIIPLLLLTLSGCNITVSAPTTSTTSTSTGGTPHWGVQTKTSGCVAHGGLADAACTPGALLATGTKAAICVSGYSSSVRNVPSSEKDKVENYLHAQVCSGAIDLQKAQVEIATNWLAVYNSMPNK